MTALPLYRRVLGADFDRMPAPVRAVHDFTGRYVGEGTATVERGNLVARAMAALLGMPQAGRDRPVRIEIDATTKGELLSRFYPDCTLRTFQTCETRKGQTLLGERFGPFRLSIALTAHARGCDFRLVRWTLGPVPLPMALAPRLVATERVCEGKHRFLVRISLPLIGLLLGYEGDVETLIPRKAATPHDRPRPPRFDVL
jgi:hypothetical protein